MIQQRDLARLPCVGKRSGPPRHELGLLPGLREVHRNREALEGGPGRDLRVERTAHGVRRVGRDAQTHPPGGEWGEILHLIPEAAQARNQLGGVGTEDFVIDNAAPTQLGERPRDRAGIAGVRDGGHPRRPALAHPAPRRLEKRDRAPRRLETADRENPIPEFRLGRGVLEAGELEVGVGVDQSGQQQRRSQLQRKSPLGPRHARIGTDLENPPAGADEHGGIGNRRLIDRESPARRQPEWFHGSASGGAHNPAAIDRLTSPRGRDCGADSARSARCRGSRIRESPGHGGKTGSRDTRWTCRCRNPAGHPA